MVCLPCLVVPALLWIFYKFIQPLLEKYFGFGSIPALTDADRSSEAYVEIQKEINENAVVIYEKSSTKQNAAKDLLDQLGVSYTLKDIEKKSNTTQIQGLLEKIAQKKEVPLVFIGAKCVGTVVDLSTLMTEGKLMNMIREVGANVKKTD